MRLLVRKLKHTASFPIRESTHMHQQMQRLA